MWSALYAGTEPIVLKFERIEIELEEPVVLVHTDPPPTTAAKPAASTASTADSYVDRLLQNIKFEIQQVVITVKTLGSAVRLRVRVQEIVVHSTDLSYQTELTHGVRVNRDNTESIQYRHVTLGRASLILVAPDTGRETALLDDTPLDVRVKMKRAVGSDTPLALQVVVELEKLAVRIGAHDYKQFERMLDSLLDCIYRGEASLLKNASVEKSTKEVGTVAATAAPAVASADAAGGAAPDDSYWGRLTSYFSRSYYSDPVATTATTTTATTVSSLDALEEMTADDDDVPAGSASSAPTEKQLLRSKFDQLASQQLQSTVLDYYDDDEDFQNTTYTFKVRVGALEALENVLQQPRRLALLEFQQL